jgi:hypothetical protein
LSQYADIWQGLDHTAGSPVVSAAPLPVPTPGEPAPRSVHEVARQAIHAYRNALHEVERLRVQLAEVSVAEGADAPEAPRGYRRRLKVAEARRKRAEALAEHLWNRIEELEAALAAERRSRGVSAKNLALAPAPKPAPKFQVIEGSSGAEFPKRSLREIERSLARLGSAADRR